MPAWLSYRPEDFLLFSERAYWRLFELGNLAVWPLQVPILLLGAAMLIGTLRPTPWSGRAIAAALAAAWVWVGLRFLGDSYAEINWMAPYAVPLFVAQGLLLAWFGPIRNRTPFAASSRPPDLLGLALFAYALALHPLIAPLAGRPIAAAEVIAIAPDPTAIATLGLLCLPPQHRPAWLLLVVPLFWCLVSAATLLTLGAAEGYIPLAAAVLALAARLRPRRRSRADRDEREASRR